MDHNKKTLPAASESPRLNAASNEPQVEAIRWNFERNRRIRQWYKLYFGTVALAILLCLSVVGYSVFQNTQITDGQGIQSDTVSNHHITQGVLLPGSGSLDSSWNTDSSSSESDSAPQAPSKLTFQTLYDFDYSAVPTGETPIIPMDLSLSEYGASYINNTTGLSPDTNALLTSSFSSNGSVEYLSAQTAPQVLILHTHGTEAYSPDGAISFREDGGEIARSTDPAQTVVSVGAVLSEELNRYGISTVHCTIMHDREQYKGAYASAEQTIRQYLQRYPSIKLVIDVHRDSIFKSTGEMVRPVTLIDGEPAAQVMCVVGSDWGGQSNPNWERNLALSLQLREKLNQAHQALCRPTYLKASTYNQEIAPYSLLLEIGSSGNSLEEAVRSAQAVARSLKDLISKL